MNKWILTLLLVSFGAKAEFKTNIKITRLAKEAVKSVEKFLGDKQHDLVLHDIDLEFMDEDGADVLDFKETLSKKSLLQFYVVNKNDHKTTGKCLDFVQYIVKLEMDKLSNFTIDIGEYKDCTGDKQPPHDMLSGVNK
jgi:hypothetical protein